MGWDPGLEFEVRRQPEGLCHLVLTNSLADMGMWSASTREFSKVFPGDVQKGLVVGVADMEAYGKVLRILHKKYGCLVDPWLGELVYSMNQSISPSADISVIVGMFIGELPTWSIIDRLYRIRVPTFVINGQADIAQDFGKRHFGLTYSRIPSEEQLSNCLLSMESEGATEFFGYRRHCTTADMAVGPHIPCNDIMVLLRTRQSSEDLDSETLASVKEPICRLESEIIAHDERLHVQATSLWLQSTYHAGSRKS